MSCYSRLIGRWPHVVLPIVILVVIACASVAVLVYPYPDLSNPIKGFEARGTPIKGREQVMYNLRDLTDTDLTEQPPHQLPPEVLNHPAVQGLYGQFAAQFTAQLGSMPEGGMPDWRLIPMEDGRTMQRAVKRPQYFQESSNDTSACDNGYVEEQPKVVFASHSGASLLTVPGIKAMCTIERRLLPDPDCQQRNSIPYLMEELYKKQCEQLTQDDITSLLQLLKGCTQYYYTGQLNASCVVPGSCLSVPSQCRAHNAVFTILHYLTDDSFFAKPPSGHTNFNDKLTYALFSTPLQGLSYKGYYREYVEGGELAQGDIYIKGVDSLIKFDLFNDYLLVDMLYFGLAMLLILIIMCVYLRSVVVTIATVLDVIFTLLLAYCIYRIVGFKHFPFMNVLTGLICIAIGADDVFIFFDTWQQVKAESPNGNIQEWMATTFHHAALSIFVTSLTTASAFFANAVSEITDIMCFGIFAGIAILCNFIFMVTWVPSIIVIVEKMKNGGCTGIQCCSCYHSCVKAMSKCNVMFDKVLPCIVKRTYFIWLPLLFLLGCGGMFAVFILPRLELPQSKEFQVFQHSDPLELWDTKLKQKFRYFQQSAENAQLSQGLPVFAVWGINEADNGSPLDPDDHGVLRFDPFFNMSSPEAQVWMEDFCISFTNSSILAPTMALVPCTLTVFNKLMALPCVHPGLSPCCNQPNAPFAEDLFIQCFPTLTHTFTSIAKLPRLPTHGQPLYNKSSGAIQGFMITAMGSQPWSPILEDMQAYHQNLESFIKEESASAPGGVENGWVTSYLKFYDLQRALSSGTYVAIGVSVAVAFVVMLLTSLNLIITVFALLTIILTIAVTVGALVLLGWELNILESVTISLAVGLSIDFTIHYGVAYRLSTSEDRTKKVKESFQRVGSPVAMAAFTTFVAGAAMMPAKVLAYTQLGVFLMIVMATSWIYSTFFFQSMCRILGPKKTAKIQCCNDCRQKPQEEDIKVHPNNAWDPDQAPHVLTKTGRMSAPPGEEMRNCGGHDGYDSDNWTCTTSLANGNGLVNGQVKGPEHAANGTPAQGPFLANNGFVSDS